jgi:tRNA nucleotidyltransferase/poly(A) polymerase
MVYVLPQRQRAFAIEIVEKLRAAGHQALFAGGCVRDQLLGHVPKDYDVATDATPDRVRQVFGRRRTVEVGASFGVVILVGPPEAGLIDVATFRQDVSYSDGRRPDQVRFTNAQEDASRRDFTINGLFLDPMTDQVIDYVGGQTDLAGRVVRAIGDPRARFTEDKLRMLRGVRFAATLNFRLDDRTRAAIANMAREIAVVSAERIAQEMRRMLVHANRAAALSLLHETGLLALVLPEVAATRETVDGAAWQHTLRVLESLDGPSFPLALAAALHATGDADEDTSHCNPAQVARRVAEVGQRWKLSNDEIERASWLVTHQNAIDDAARIPWPRLQRTLIQPGIDELLALRAAIDGARGRAANDVDYCRGILRQPRPAWDPPPLLTGDDLIAHGLRPGKAFKTILEAIRDAQLERKITTRDEGLALAESFMARDPAGGQAS